jgi:hypothetical protein
MKAGLLKLLGGTAAMIVAGGAALASLSAPAGAGSCYAIYSNVNTPGPVCADAQVAGFHEGDVLTPGGDPKPAWGDSVSFNYGGGGTGITGAVSVSGTFGTGHVKAESHIDAPRPDSSQVTARGYFAFNDTFKVISATDVQANFQSSLEGAFSGAGSGEAVLRVQDLGNFAVAVDDLTTLVNETFSSNTRTALVTLTAGHEYSLSWSMKALADTMVDFFTNRPNATADLSNTGHLYIDVVTPGGKLTFASGHNYSSSPVAATPLPPSFVLMLSALGGFGLLAARRRRTLGTR